MTERLRRRSHETDALIVSGARPSRQSDIGDRRRKYLLTMSVRTLAFIAAVVLFALDLRWEAAVVLALSLVAPIIGVIVANNHVRSGAGQPEIFRPEADGMVPVLDPARTIDL